MSQKTKDIIFYVLAIFFIASAIACTVCEAIFGKDQLPTWASILLCVGIFVFALAGTFLASKSVDSIKNRIKELKDNKKENK